LGVVLKVNDKSFILFHITKIVQYLPVSNAADGEVDFFATIFHMLFCHYAFSVIRRKEFYTTSNRPDHDQQHCYHHAPTVKPEAVNAVVSS